MRIGSIAISTVLCLASIKAGKAFAAEIRITSPDRDQNTITMTMSLAENDYQLTPVVREGRLFSRLERDEPSDLSRVGLPDIPTYHRWLAVPKGSEYKVRVEFAAPVRYEDVLLIPVQPDKLEKSPVSPFRMDLAAYSRNHTYGEAGVVTGSESHIGPLTIQPLTFTPVHYNPRSRVLTVWREATITLTRTDDGTDSIATSVASLTTFQRGQVRALVLNGESLLNIYPRTEGERLLVITTEGLLASAQVFADMYATNGRSVEFKTVTSRTSSSQIKTLIQNEFNTGNLDSVLIFGDESQVKLHYWSGNVPGDSYYSFVSGNDYIADIGLGRLPVSNLEEASHIINKMKVYAEIQSSGHTTKDVMLVAHKENYPGKYTANMEDVRQADNPRALVFETQYGGAGALNRNVIERAPEGYAIINYRGHGTNQTWVGWDRQGQSFGTNQIRDLANFDEDLAVFFNIACSNGALQSSNHSMAENLLFEADATNPNRGAVAVVAATIESMTETNHRFNRYLFTYLQTEQNLTLGNINALANNKLVRDNGGRLPSNVKMYILFGSPLLMPWIE